MKGKRDGMGEANRFKPPGTRIRIELRRSCESGNPVLDRYAAPAIKIALGSRFRGNDAPKGPGTCFTSRQAPQHNELQDVSSIVPNLSAFISV